MKKILATALLSLALIQPALAAEQAPSDASLAELLAVTKTQSLLISAQRQIDLSMQTRMNQLLAGQQVTPEQKKILEDMRLQIMNLVTAELKWEKLAPQYLDMYKKTFSQKEVDGMLDFYKSDAGQAVINKMPAVMQYSMQLVQNMIATLMPKMLEIQKDSLAKLQATKK